MDVFHTQIQKAQQNDDCFLFIPRDVVDDGQVVDILQTEYFLQFQGNDRQRIGVVALTGIQYAGDAANIAQRQFGVFILCTAGSQDNRILRQGFGKFCIVITGFHSAVTARHDNEFFDSTGFYGINDFIRQCQYLSMGEAADDLTGFDLLRCGTLFCMFDDFGEILFFADIPCNMLTAGITCRTCGVHAVLVAVLWRDDAVCCHQDRTAEGFEFLFLLPPCVAVVAKEMVIFLEGGIIMGRQHFGMGIDIHATVLTLFQQHFQITQVVTGNQNTGACANTNVDFSDLRVAVRGSVCSVQ